MTGGGTRYAAVVVPAGRYLPLETFSQIVALANQGASVIALGGFAADVSGLADLSSRREQFRRAIAAIQFGAADADGIAEARVGSGRILRGDNLETLLARAGVARESMVDHGLEFARRRSGQGRFYFISNSSAADLNGWVPLDPSRAARAGARSDARQRAGRRRRDRPRGGRRGSSRPAGGRVAHALGQRDRGSANRRPWRPSPARRFRSTARGR